MDYPSTYDSRLRVAMGIRENEHFTEALYQEAVGEMVNEDGTKGPHYSVDEVQEIVKKHKIELLENNIYDYAYVLNMVYSDYFGAIPDNEKSYVGVANAFIFDEDGPKGKAIKYYVAMKYGIAEGLPRF